MIEAMPITFACVRKTSQECLRSFEVPEEDLQGPVDEHGDPVGDPSLLPIVVPPHGWFDDPEATQDDQFVCVNCATTEEIANWMAGAAEVERQDPLGLRDEDDEDD